MDFASVVRALSCLPLGLGLSLGIVGLGIIGCSGVMPYERGDLARRCMQSPFSQMELRSDYENKVHQTQTAAELPGGTPGGGCGCTN